MNHRFLFAGLAALLCLPGLADAKNATPPSDPWPQDLSDIKPDPAVKFGTLANGMRYAVMANHMPKGQVSLRLRIDAGAFQENEHQAGLAHFLEHMAFRGSTHVPDNEAFRILERFGAALGADSNAFTTQSQTVYKIDLPKNDSAGIDTALMLMRETAGELSLSEASVDFERSVVLSEERARDTPVFRLFKDQRAFVFKDQPIGSHMPIGDVEVLKAAHAADLRAFYEAYYRPERATLVVVGDISPAAIEKKIKLKFAQWQGKGTAGGNPVYGPPLKRGQEIATRVEPGAPTSISLEWTKPADPRPDNKARERDGAVSALGMMILNQRLDDMRLSANPPFLRAGASFQDIRHSAAAGSLGASTTEQGWQAGLDAITKAQGRILADGVTQAELERERANWRTRLENAVASASTRRSSPLADGLAGSVDRGDVFVTPATDLAMFDQMIKSVTVREVNAALRASFTGNGPLLFLGGPQPMTGAEEALNAALKVAAEPQKADEVSQETWPYTNFGEPGVVVERSEIADLGTTQLRFANGVRLTVKPTQFHADQILVSVNIGHGRLDLSADGRDLAWTIGSGAFLLGGYQALTLPEIKRLMTGKQSSVGLSLGDNSVNLSGSTRPQDLANQMQRITAYLTAPGWRPEGLELVRNNLVNAFPQWEANPVSVFQREAGQLMHDGDQRWHQPDLAQVRAVRYDQMRSLIEPVLTREPIEICIVGDITVDKAIAEVAATLGALPARDAETAVPDANRHVVFPGPTGEPILLHHKGRPDQGFAVAAWPTADQMTDLHAARSLRVLQLILGERLIDEFRTKLGGSYSPGADLDASLEFPGYGYILAYAETPENKMGAFDDTVAAIARDLREKEVSPDEFERARKPRVETLLKAQQTNEYWLGALQRIQTEPFWQTIIRTTISDMQSVTPADVRKMAETYLRDDRLWRLRVTPEPASPAAEGEKGKS